MFHQFENMAQKLMCGDIDPQAVGVAAAEHVNPEVRAKDPRLALASRNSQSVSTSCQSAACPHRP